MLTSTDGNSLLPVVIVPSIFGISVLFGHRLAAVKVILGTFYDVQPKQCPLPTPVAQAKINVDDSRRFAFLRA